jgi:hypothetical protein
VREEALHRTHAAIHNTTHEDAMKAQASKSRTARSPGRKPVQSAPLTQMLVLDALRTWVVPTLAVVVGLAIFVADNIGAVAEATAVTVVGAMALLTVLFTGLRGFLEPRPSGALAGALAVFAVLFGISAFYPFYRTLNPGAPVVSTELKRGAPATLPLRDKPGHYSVIVEGHFLPVEGQQNRTAAYSIALGHDGATDRVLSGAFSQEWRSQRAGIGRRSFVVPTLHQTNEVRDVIDDPDGRDLTATLTDLSPGVRDSVLVRLYSETVPQWAFIALGVFTLAAAVIIDGWRPKGESEGLLGTLTAATLLSVVVFARSTVATPGFPQLIIAVLVGAVVGGLAGGLLWRLSSPLKKFLPAME